MFDCLSLLFLFSFYVCLTAYLFFLCLLNCLSQLNKWPLEKLVLNTDGRLIACGKDVNMRIFLKTLEQPLYHSTVGSSQSTFRAFAYILETYTYCTSFLNQRINAKHQSFQSKAT